MLRVLLCVVAISLTTLPVAAQEPIRFARTPDISPDGKLIAFSYLGDIFTVETIGGTARAITTHPAHEINPVFSPDGQHLAFSSNRHGSYDVFVVSARGGKPTRLTFDSAADMVCGWTPDGKNILFASSRSMEFPPSLELYLVPITGGRVTRVTVAEGKEGVYSPSGDQLLYVRGPGMWYRKGYRGSSNDDLWLCNADGTHNRRITTFQGQDHSPMWSPDGQTIYYVSEIHGVANIVKQAPTMLPPSAKPTALTQHTDESVRRARLSRNGEWIVYECGPDLWVVSTKENSQPRKVAIEVNADDKSNNERVLTFTRGVTQYALSPDEKFVVFAVQGKLFRLAVNPNARAVQLTHGPSNDHGAIWSPDGSKLLFLSDRDGQEDIYLLEQDDPDHPKLTDAYRFKITRLTHTREAESGVSFSPDGKRVAFLSGGKLHTMTPDGKDLKTIVDQVAVFDYDWSPDGRWFVFARRDGSFASELYIVPSTGPTAVDPIRNITRYATFNAGVTWSADGKKLAFLSERRGAANLHVLSLEKPQAESSASANKPPTPPSPVGLWGSRPPLSIDWDDIHLRAQPVVRGLVDEAVISPDGSKVAFRDTNSRDLWVASSNGSSVTRLTTGGLNPRQIQWSRRKNVLGATIELLYFLDGQGNFRLCNASSNLNTPSPPGEPRPATPPTERLLTMPFKIRMSIRQDELFTEMFDQSWRYLSEHFYDENFHDRNWDEVRQRYRPLVKHVAMKEDLYALLYLMMGELNASHLGVTGFITGPEEDTAELGLLWDQAHKGKGLKIAEILKRGPADRKGIQLKPGEYVVAIDGVELTEQTNLSRLLNGKVGEAVFLSIATAPDAPKERWRRVELQGMPRFSGPNQPLGVADLMYDRWVAKNAAKVAELSGGKLGYIHIPSMDENGLDAFVRSLYSDNFDKEAIVLDVRYNGGGFTHDQVLNYLGSKEHTIFRNRDGGQGSVLRAWDRKWHKPVVLLINNRSYSDAEIFPNAFKTLGLGKLVGEPTGGFVIGTSVVPLIDGSIFRIPRIGVWTTKGVNMEKQGVQPDILVENHPDQLAKGDDAQLARAVQTLQVEVVEWKKQRAPETVIGSVKPPVPPNSSSVAPSGIRP